MAIKVTLGATEKTQQITYPRLMIREDQDLLIIFTCPTDGVVINGGSSPYKDFEDVEDLSLSYFKDFKGVITLQNQ